MDIVITSMYSEIDKSESMSHIQIRIDEKTKKSAKKVLDELGLDMTSAIRIFLKQVVLRRKLPFEILTENGLTIEQEAEILKASEEAKRGINVTKAMTPKEALEYLRNL